MAATARMSVMWVLAVLVGLLAPVMGPPVAAEAATGNILAPFTQGETWRIYQGYSSGTHTGTSQYGIDLTIGTSATSTAGKVVRAPMAGTIYYWDSPYGNLCINTGNGRSYTLTHINPSKTSGTVAAGEALGTVAPAGQRGNNNVAHLHFEFWSATGCYNRGTPLALSAANGLRMCGAPDLPASGPNGGNGIWSGTTFTAQPCGSAGVNPIGSYDGLSSPQPGTIRVRGWALDMDKKTTAIGVHVYVGGPAGQGTGTAITANTTRTDVGAAYPGTGNNHGFDATIETTRTGSVPVYVYAINASGTGGGNVLLRSKSVQVASGSPHGSFDSAFSATPGKLTIRGWAIDPSAPAKPVNLYFTVGGQQGETGATRVNLGPANRSRPDVAVVHPAAGAAHGYDAQVRTPGAGTFVVYLYAEDLAGTPGTDTLLGTKTVTVLAAPQPMFATARPAITGKARVGRLLRASTGKWSQPGVTLRYRWFRNGKAIRGATSSAYKLRRADVRKRVSVRITASKDGYATVTVTSARTKKVKPKR
ncbi:M23 family metallopeptidase [Nocardioides sp. zg-ZUI104]|uniref:M23 family metallopeptidase n=1 Tax=Nocardioides faecalis TaxID=2803858 RepID=UPI001BCE85BB|nr:M23 family metallopeptidase [Nocardioides faecalis]MBS4753243.1 M23 family metallopeptidase [Nocardioides faecalis]